MYAASRPDPSLVVAAPVGTVLLPSLEAVYREHWRYVIRCLTRMGVPRHLVDDVAQDVFVVVARRLPGFEPRASIRTWLFAIVLRVVKAHRRSFARRELGPAESPAPVGDAETDVAAREAALVLERLLARISVEQRAVFVLAELEETPAPEIAEALGLSVNTIYSRLRLARARLQRLLARERARERRSPG